MLQITEMTAAFNVNHNDSLTRSIHNANTLRIIQLNVQIQYSKPVIQKGFIDIYLDTFILITDAILSLYLNLKFQRSFL